MATSFVPGFQPSFGLVPNILPPAGTGVYAAGSALEIALNSVAPDGLGPLAPLWKLLFNFIKRRTNFDITSITRKVLITFGAAVGIRFAWNYAKPLFLDHLTSRITLPMEHKTARGIQKWIDAQGFGRASRHLKYPVTSTKWNATTQMQDFIGEKRTAITGGIFFFQKHPLYIVFQTPKNKDEKDTNGQYVSSERNAYGMRDAFELSGDRITVYSIEPFGSLLQRFSDYVSIEETKESRVTRVFTVSPAKPDRYGAPRLWNQRIKPVRPLSTIDLDEQVKSDLVSDVDRFLSNDRAKWYSARGIPYKHGIIFQGPPGTGKSSISLALAGHVGGPLYTIAIGEVRNEAHLMELFQDAKHGSIVLLEDVDPAGIGREVAKGSGDNQKESGNVGPTSPAASPADSISLSGLLNAIDALADGVLLIMTSNEPKNLDKALIWPGRIDKKNFKRFYSENSTDQDALNANNRIAELATEFAGKIPDLKLTPAEIQGLLIPLSDTPMKAIEDADGWVTNLLAAKAAGKNVVEKAEMAVAEDFDSDTFYDTSDGTDSDKD